MLPRHRNAGSMNDVGLNTASPKPTRQPEPVATSLKSDNQARDAAAGFRRLVPPAMQQPKDVVFVRPELLQRRTAKPGTIPPTSQLDRLISITAISVLS